MNTVNQQSVSSPGFSNSFASSDADKYNGMVPVSIFKKIRNSIFSLYSYVQMESPPFQYVHVFVSVIRLLQIIGPAIMAPFNSFWDINTNAGKLVNIISACFHFCPENSRLDATTAVSYLYISMVFAFIAFFFSCAYYYKVHGVLTNWVPIAISLIIDVLCFIVHPMALEVSSEMIGRLITNPSGYNLTSAVVQIVLVFVFFGIYLIVMRTILSTSIIFRPSSLISVLDGPQNILIEFTSLITVILGIASKLSSVPMDVLLGVSAGVYILMGYMCTRNGGLIKNFDRCAVTALSASGAIFCCYGIIMDRTHTVATEITLSIGVVIIIVAYVITVFVNQRIARLSVGLLDQIENDQANFEKVGNVNRFASLITRGFEYAHPVCLSWQIFRYAVDKWPNDIDAWIIFAKFVAIYPEENQTLSWILHQIISMKMKGSSAKHIIIEIVSLLRQRESNISPQVKRKLNIIAKSVLVTKHKLRHIWDLVIQGNTSEMDSIIARTKSSIEQNEGEYLHLLHQYPNCRFVVRSYARFKYEVCADHEGFKIWNEKAKLMQKGIRVQMDQARELGLTLFNNIPDSIKATQEATPSVAITADSESQLIDIKQDDETSSLVSEQISQLRKKIDSLTIPGVRNSSIANALCFVILFLAPIIIGIVYSSTAISQWEEPLNFLYTLSYLRSEAFNLPQYGLRRVLETIGVMRPLKKTISSDFTAKPVSLGSTNDLNIQFSHLMIEVTNFVQDLNDLQTFETNNTVMNEVREMIFGANTQYYSVSNSTTGDTTVSTITLQSAIMNIIAALQQTLDYNLTSSAFNSSSLVEPTRNEPELTNIISTILDLIGTYEQNTYSSVYNCALIVTICVACSVAAILIVVAYFTSKKVDQDKMTIFKCLTAIPKNHVSVVADSLKSMKKEQEETSSKSEGDSEMNKQEENMIKIFMTASDSSGAGISHNIAFYITQVLLVLCHAASTVSIGFIYLNANQGVNDVAPHVSDVLGCFGYQLGAFHAITQLAAFSNGYVPGNEPKSYISNMISQRSNLSSYYYHRARYGTEDGTVSPFKAFGTAITTLNAETRCDNTTTYAVPVDVFHAAHCFSLEMVYYMMSAVLSHIAQPYIQNGTPINLTSDLFEQSWIFDYYFVYDEFFYPIFQDLIPSAEEEITSNVQPCIIAAISLLSFAFIVYAITIYKNIQKSSEMKFALSLLLHYQPSVILQIPIISQVLAQKFEVKSGESASRDAEFFDSIIEKLPDATIIVGKEGQIQSVNEAASRQFGITKNSTSAISNFFNSEKFDGTAKGIGQSSSQPVEVTFRDDSGSKDYLVVSENSVGDTKIYTARNITQTKRYNQLIDEEIQRSEKLLQSILPARLVPRVQSGEKNISFSVQSASIVFIDIVEFTPWCASNTAATVMQTLSTLFGQFDALIANLPTMTKIKCIGDCYMAAGGIFSEVNQPTVHATEATTFGLQAIEAVEGVNKQLGINLRVRVGINTGGPIVAGVIGCGKPTFEILGPAINMAQQMEHHGVPMAVHVSRPVYELIYGSTFNIKERGQIEIKNGTAVTYIVSKK